MAIIFAVWFYLNESYAATFSDSESVCLENEARATVFPYRTIVPC